MLKADATNPLFYRKEEKKMTRNQSIAIELLNMIKKGAEIQIEYRCIDDELSFWYYKNSVVDVIYIFNYTSEEQAVVLYNKCKAIIESKKINAEATRNQKLAIRLINKVEKGMDIKIEYNCCLDDIKLCHDYLNDQFGRIEIRKRYIDEDFRKCLRVIKDAKKSGF